MQSNASSCISKLTASLWSDVDKAYRKLFRTGSLWLRELADGHDSQGARVNTIVSPSCPNHRYHVDKSTAAYRYAREHDPLSFPVSIAIQEFYNQALSPFACIPASNSVFIPLRQTYAPSLLSDFCTQAPLLKAIASTLKPLLHRTYTGAVGEGGDDEQI